MAQCGTACVDAAPSPGSQSLADLSLKGEVKTKPPALGPVPGVFFYHPSAMIHRFFASLHPRMLPPMTRQSYRHELVTALSYPVVLSLIESAVIGIIAKRLFDVSDMLFAAILAAENFANLSSFVWARLSRGRRKVRVINGLQLSLIACVALIGVLPVNYAGGLGLTLLVIVARSARSG